MIIINIVKKIIPLLNSYGFSDYKINVLFYALIYYACYNNYGVHCMQICRFLQGVKLIRVHGYQIYTLAN